MFLKSYTTDCYNQRMRVVVKTLARRLSSSKSEDDQNNNHER